VEDFAMKNKFSVEQIVSVLKQAEMGVPIAELIRKVGITEQTYYRWKAKYAGLEVDQVRQIKQLRDENTRLKQLVGGTDAGQDDVAGCATKRVVKPSRRRPLVTYLEQTYPVSEQHTCCVLEVARATHRYEGYTEQWIELRMRIREIAQARVRYGYRMIRVLLNREGWKVRQGPGIPAVQGRRAGVAHEKLQNDEAGFIQELKILNLLLKYVENAERQAKEHYLAPIMKRIELYLQKLFPGAGIVCDEDFHITGMSRADQISEQFDSLSDGTQEQVAVDWPSPIFC
jgi:hypothetical protein